MTNSGAGGNDLPNKPKLLALHGMPCPDQQSLCMRVRHGSMNNRTHKCACAWLLFAGWRSHSAVTFQQIKNLGLCDYYDVTYLDGPIQSETGADHLLNAAFDGPFYSWFDNEHGSDPSTPMDTTDGRLIVDALRHLVDEVIIMTC